MNIAVTTIIFDIGGVLITPSEKITPFILSELFSLPLELAIQEYTQALPRLRTGSLAVSQMIEDLKKRHVPVKNISNLEQLYLELYQKQAVINEDVMRIIGILHETHTTVAFCNMIDLHVRCNEERQLFRHFRHVYLSSVTGLVKPEKAAFEHVLHDLGAPAASCVFIDDKKENIDAARSLGFVTYLYDTDFQLKGFLQKEGLLS